MKANRPNKAPASFADAVRGKKTASFVGELSSGYDPAEKNPGYEVDGAQKGKAHQEAVNKGGKTGGGAHFDDKRDVTGKAASANEIQKAAKDLRVVAATLSRAAGKLGSYIGELSTGYDPAEKSPGYDIDGPQKGKKHQDAVNKGGKTSGGAHFDDKRDGVGKAAGSAGMRMLGEALLVLEKEAASLTDVQQTTLSETFKQLGREFDKTLDKKTALDGEYKSDVEVLVSAKSGTIAKSAKRSMATKDAEWIEVSAGKQDADWIEVEAAGHPIEDEKDRFHTKYEGKEIGQDAMDAEKWFAPPKGQGKKFDDSRDKAERATSKELADHTS